MHRMCRAPQRLGVVGLRRHRRLWLGMVKVMYGLSKAWGRTGAVLLGIFFVSFVSISFVLMHMVVVNDLGVKSAWLVTAYVCVALGIFSICAAAQTMTDAVSLL